MYDMHHFFERKGHPRALYLSSQSWPAIMDQEARLTHRYPPYMTMTAHLHNSEQLT